MELNQAEATTPCRERGPITFRLDGFSVMVEPPKDQLSEDLLRAFGAEEANWSWRSRYHPALRDHMHALGVVVANYNHLEFVLQLMLCQFSSFEFDVSAKLFSTLNSNRNRLDILARLVNSREKDDTVKDLAHHFLKGFDICAENRNFLMHGMVHNGTTSLDLTLHKAARNDPSRTNYLHLTVRAIRRIADEIHDFDSFGFDITFWMSARLTGGKYILPNGSSIEPTLPEKPPLPDKLNLSDHPIQATDLLPPERSQA